MSMKPLTAPISIFVLTMGFLVFPFCSAKAQINASPTTESAASLDVQPRFPSGANASASEEEKTKGAEKSLEKFIQEHLQYPQAAKGKDFKPRMVRVRITIDPNGKVHSPRILELGTKEYDDNALAVVKKMEQNDVRWSPGILAGQAVRTAVMIPVQYTWEGRNRAFPDVPDQDDRIHELVDEVPAFAHCRQKGKSDEAIRDCSIAYINDFFAENMVFEGDGPDGDVHAEFVVDKSGFVRNLTLKNDAGSALGAETLRLFNLMNEKNISWLPGEEDGQKVNVRLRISLHFQSEKSTGKPAGTEYALNKPAASKPGVGVAEPVSNKVPVNKPATTEESAATKPAASEPPANKSAASQPAANKPAASQPVANKPAAGEPAANKPVAGKPATGENAVAAKPAATKPAVPVVKMSQVEAKFYFSTGVEGYEKYQAAALKMPAPSKKDGECAFGVLDVKFKVNPQSGAIVVTDLVDYSDLGKEFKAAVNNFLLGSNGQWRKDAPVLDENTQFSLSIPMTTNNATCLESFGKYKETINKSVDNYALTTNENTLEQGLQILDEAIEQYPQDNKILRLRGMALFKNEHTVEGCLDLKLANSQNKSLSLPSGCK
jgi:TonB family protein